MGNQGSERVERRSVSQGHQKTCIILAATMETPALDGLNVRPGERTWPSLTQSIEGSFLFNLSKPADLSCFCRKGELFQFLLKKHGLNHVVGLFWTFPIHLKANLESNHSQEELTFQVIEMKQTFPQRGFFFALSICQKQINFKRMQIFSSVFNPAL